MEVYTHAIPAPSMEAEGEDCEFQGSVSYIASFCVNKQSRAPNFHQLLTWCVFVTAVSLCPQTVLQLWDSTLKPTVWRSCWFELKNFTSSFPSPETKQNL